MGKRKTNSIQRAAKANATFISSDLSSRDRAEKLLKERKSKTNKDDNFFESNKAKQLAMKRFAVNEEIRKKEDYCTVKEFEDDVELIEGIKIIIRASKGAKVMRYPYKKRASSDTTIKAFLIRRIERTLQHDYEVEILPKGTSHDITLGDLRRYH